MRKVDKIIVHCTATPQGRVVTVNDVDRWHRDQGYTCIGYHYLVGLNGELWTGRGLEQEGAHCLGQNKTSIGVCYVGGLAADGKTAKDTRTAVQKQTLIRLLRQLKGQFPGVSVHGHNEFANKACPCFDAKNEYKNI